jgi:hypothetical protein
MIEYIALRALYRRLTEPDVDVTIDAPTLADQNLALVELREVTSVPVEVAHLAAAVDTAGPTGCYVRYGSPQMLALRDARWTVDHGCTSPLLLVSVTWPGDIVRMIPAVR